MQFKKASGAATFGVALLAALAGCPGTTQAVVTCATSEGKALAEQLGTELAILWGQDRAAWERRAREIAQQRGASLLQCIADQLRRTSLASDDHVVALDGIIKSL